VKIITGKAKPLVISFLILFVLFVTALWIYKPIARRFPLSQSRIQLAQASVTKNADWRPVVHHFNKLDWALVPSGCFHMGSTESQVKEALAACKVYGGADCPYVFDQVAQPSADVCFDNPYWIGVTEVTNREYGSSSSTNMTSMYRGPNWPRETVTWQEASDFCMSIGSRLPTEAEWEYAGRGPDGLIYPWGNEMSPSYKQQAGRLNPQDVGSIRADVSWVGAEGMSGNVMEWVNDVFDPASTLIKPNTLQNNQQRIVRGGSWASYQDFLLRTTQRMPFDPEYASSVIGFRCMRDFE